jgi:hypothetical protein
MQKRGKQNFKETSLFFFFENYQTENFVHRMNIYRVFEVCISVNGNWS